MTDSIRSLCASLVRRGAPVLAVAAAMVVRWLLNPLLGTEAPRLFFFLAVAFAVWQGGVGAAFVAIVLSALVSTYFFVPPYGTIRFHDLHDFFAYASFLGVASAIALLIASLKAARAESDRNAHLARNRLDELSRQRSCSEVILASIGDAVVSTDAAGSINFMNAVAERLTGWSAAEALGKPLDEVLVIVNEHSHERIENPLTRVLREGVIVGLANHSSLRRRDGTLVAIDDSAAPVRDAKGAIAGAVLIFRDISARLVAERALAESEHQLRVVTESIPQQVWTALPDGSVDFCNQRWLQYTGLTQEEARGDAWTVIVHPEDRERVVATWKRAVAEASAYEIEARLREADGGYRWFLSRGVPVRDEAGRVVRWYSTNTDIEQRKRAEESLREGEQRLRLALDAGRMGTWDWQIATGRVEWSPGLERIHGRETGSLPNRFEALFDDIHPEDQARVQSAIAEGLERGSDNSAEYRVVRPDGAIRWVEARWRVYADLGGRPQRVMGVSIDVTERRAAEAVARQAEERYRTIVETANEGVWLVDREANTEYVNRRLLEMLGYSEAEMIGRSLFEFCFPGDLERARTRLGANLSGTLEQFDFRFRHKRGQQVLVLGSTSPVRGAQGEICGAVGLFSDVTERRNAERALRQSEGTLRALVESAAQGIVAVDPQGRIALVNAKTEEVFGYARGELLGQPLEMLVPEHLRDVHRRHRQAYLAEPRSRPMGMGLDLSARRKDGTPFPVEISLSYVDEGPTPLILALITDITERRWLEERFQEAGKLESLGVLAGGIAHDFNNLLTGIIGGASLALDDLPPGHSSHRLIEGVVRAGEMAAHLTQQMLAYSGRGRFVVEMIDVNTLLGRMRVLLGSSVPRTAQLITELAPGVPPVEADAAQIQQLIMNLVINAAEALEERPGRVTLRTGVRHIGGESARIGLPQFDLVPGDYVFIAVSDSGCGMDEQTRRRIFDPFFTTKFTGRGLGLAAALGIARGHKGAIDVESEPGRGSSFTVLLPAAGAQPAPAEPPPATPSAARISGTVLVVDDEEVVRGAAKEALERIGFNVLLAENGQAALALFGERADEISLVLLDMTMPVMSGEETLRHMREIRDDIAVILSSGFNEVEALRRFQAHPLSGFIQKPYTAARLQERVRAVVASMQRTAGRGAA